MHNENNQTNFIFQSEPPTIDYKICPLQRYFIYIINSIPGPGLEVHVIVSENLCSIRLVSEFKFIFEQQSMAVVLYLNVLFYLICLSNVIAIFQFIHIIRQDGYSQEQVLLFHLWLRNKLTMLHLVHSTELAICLIYFFKIHHRKPHQTTLTTKI